jgi:acyl carrier protein
MMFLTLEDIQKLPKFEYDGFTLGEEVLVHDESGRHRVTNGYLAAINISDKILYDVAFLREGDLYVVVKGCSEVSKIDDPELPDATVNAIKKAIISLIAELYMHQMEIYDTMTFEELDLDSLDLMEIISKVEYDFKIDIDISIISLTDTIDVIANKIIDSLIP